MIYLQEEINYIPLYKNKQETLFSLWDNMDLAGAAVTFNYPVFFGRNDAKAETPVLWPPHVKSWLIGKDSDAWRDWGQEEKGTTEDKMAGWHHRLNGHEFEWTPGVGDGQGGLACCDSWGRKESTWLNWTELNNPTTESSILSTYVFQNLF